MKNFLAWQDQMNADSDMYVDVLVEEAKTCKTPEAGVKMLKGLKQGFPDGYSGTRSQAIINVMNQTIDDAITKVRKLAMKQKWSD